MYDWWYRGDERGGKKKSSDLHPVLVRSIYTGMYYSTNLLQTTVYHACDGYLRESPLASPNNVACRLEGDASCNA